MSQSADAEALARALGLAWRRLEIPDLVLFRGDRKSDIRGWVQPTFNAELLRQLGADFSIRHENHCLSPQAGTVRGFHYQIPPFGQAKLIRVVRGRMLDVNIDMRRSSSTFGKHVKVELSADGWNQIFVPEGFAHCYMTLEPDTEVIFQLGADFAPDHAVGLAWNDPELGIDWPKTVSVTVLERDVQRPRFSALTEFFP
jgi:dTDP-4-dehydrorhamnose 3,5-epimerase